ncbi:MAG: hypothetical protein AAGJ09_10395 [Pseudomonadota bacterium]
MVPLAATVIFVVGVLAGIRYRTAWKRAEPTWRLWLYGLVSLGCFALLAFIPLSAA